MYYEVVTEFQPKSQELVFKDYVKVVDEELYNDKVVYKYKFINKNLVLNFVQPRMKSQLKVDFPDIKKIRVVMFVVVTGYSSVENSLRDRFKKCGMNSLETVQKYT